MNYVNYENMEELLEGIAKKIGGGGAGNGLQDWQPSTEYKDGDIFVYEGQIYKSYIDFTSSSTFENTELLEEYELQGGETPIPFEEGTSISTDDIVSYDTKYYKALTNFVCGTEFSLYAFNQYVPQELTEIEVQDIVNSFIVSYTGGGNSPSNDGVPVGTIINFMGTIAPDKYLVCDGTLYNIADYTILAEFIETQFGAKDFFGGDGTTTFAVPDLRGEFLRGTGTNSHENQGSGANVGTHQDGTEIPYFQTWTQNASSTSVNLCGEIKDGGIANQPNKADSSIQSSSRIIGQTTTTKENIGGTHPYTYMARPTNTSVLYCIKYR